MQIAVWTSNTQLKYMKSKQTHFAQIPELLAQSGVEQQSGCCGMLLQPLSLPYLDLTRTAQTHKSPPRLPERSFRWLFSFYSIFIKTDSCFVWNINTYRWKFLHSVVAVCMLSKGYCQWHSWHEMTPSARFILTHIHQHMYHMHIQSLKRHHFMSSWGKKRLKKVLQIWHIRALVGLSL